MAPGTAVRSSQTFVINLDRSPYRLDYLRRRFEETGLPAFRRHPAIDGDAYRPEDLRRLRDEGTIGRHWMDGQQRSIAVCLTHLAVWQAIVDEDHAWAVVLEDDADLLPMPPDGQLRDFRVAPDADVVSLQEGLASRRRRHGFPLFSGGYGCHGYLISKAGAAKAIRCMTPAETAIDYQWYSYASSYRWTWKYRRRMWRFPRKRLRYELYLHEPPLISLGPFSVASETDSGSRRAVSPEAIVRSLAAADSPRAPAPSPSGPDDDDTAPR